MKQLNIQAFNELKICIACPFYSTGIKENLRDCFPENKGGMVGAHAMISLGFKFTGSIIYYKILFEPKPYNLIYRHYKQSCDSYLYCKTSITQNIVQLVIIVCIKQNI
jgi:hypothetical protein